MVLTIVGLYSLPNCFFKKKRIKDEYKYADDNGAVGDVKGRVMPAKGVEVEEVYHGAKAGAVYDIADRTADHYANADFLCCNMGCEHP